MSKNLGAAAKIRDVANPMRPRKSSLAEKLSALKTADYFVERAARGDVDAALRSLARPGGEPP
jgi:hypothetical protein